MRIGKSKICIGNDGSSPTGAANTCLPQDIVEGGFQDLQLLEGRYLYFFRVGGNVGTITGLGFGSRNIYNLSHLSLY